MDQSPQEQGFDDFLVISALPNKPRRAWGKLLVSVPQVIDTAATEEDAKAAAARHMQDYHWITVHKSWAEFETAQRKAYLKQPLTEIGEAGYRHALNILPPLAWQRMGLYERFMIPEPVSGNVHAQFLLVDGKGYVGYADRTDQSTWLSPERVKEDALENTRRIRITYEIVTYESAEHGDAAERGFEDEDGVPFDHVGEAIEWLNKEGIAEASSSDIDHFGWLIGHHDQDFRTGDTKTKSYHPVGFTDDEMDAIFLGTTRNTPPSLETVLIGPLAEALHEAFWLNAWLGRVDLRSDSRFRSERIEEAEEARDIGWIIRTAQDLLELCDKDPDSSEDPLPPVEKLRKLMDEVEDLRETYKSETALPTP
jgi:hypothetical protein